jgi:hypothetical protein
LIRVIALFFIFYTGVDLISPQPCGEELAGLSAAQIAEVSASRSTIEPNSSPISLIKASDHSQHEQPTIPNSDDDDCFCCCSHVLPGMGFTSVIACEPIQLSIIISINSPLSPPLTNAYHPPRFA